VAGPEPAGPRWPPGFAAAGTAIGLGLALFFLAPGQLGQLGGGLAALGVVLCPAAGLLAAFATLPLHLYTRSLGGQAISSTELTILAAAISLGLRLLTGRSRQSLSPRRSPFDWPAALLVASGILSLLVTEYLRLSLRELRVLILEPVLAFYLLRVCFPGPRMVWPLAAFLAGAVGVALGGLIALPLGWGVSETEGVRRLQATYLSANHLALLLGRALPWLLAMAWATERWRWPLLAVAGVVSLALGLTFSLGGWLGSGAALVFVAWALGGLHWLALGLAASGLAGGVGVLLFRAERVRTAVFRLHLWQSSLDMLRDHPLLGIGLDNFLYLYQQRYILPSALAEPNLSHPHNLLLHFWLQLGLPGLAALLWILLRAGRVLAAQLANAPDRWSRALTVGAAASLIDFGVHGFIDNSYFLPDLALVFWLTLAVLGSDTRRRVQ
jgi:O-antigen ligase